MRRPKRGPTHPSICQLRREGNLLTQAPPGAAPGSPLPGLPQPRRGSENPNAATSSAWDWVGEQAGTMTAPVGLTPPPPLAEVRETRAPRPPARQGQSRWAQPRRPLGPRAPRLREGHRPQEARTRGGDVHATFSLAVGAVLVVLLPQQLGQDELVLLVQLLSLLPAGARRHLGSGAGSPGQLRQRRTRAGAGLEKRTWRRQDRGRSQPRKPRCRRRRQLEQEEERRRRWQRRLVPPPRRAGPARSARACEGGGRGIGAGPRLPGGAAGRNSDAGHAAHAPNFPGSRSTRY